MVADNPNIKIPPPIGQETLSVAEFKQWFNGLFDGLRVGGAVTLTEEHCEILENKVYRLKE